MDSLQAKNAQGFTLIELIAIVVLLSVLGVVAMGRLGSLGGFEQRALFDEVVGAVQYARKLAISTGCNVQVQLTGSGYNLHQGASGCTDASYTRNVLDPASRGSAYEKINDPNISIATAATFVFTSDSRVTSVAGNQLGNQTFTVNGRSFTVYGLTGLVDVL
jgi:MSHA pilin protein MshC